MIDKIIAIRNVGKFGSYKSVGDTGFGRVTLIHAENAHGKTTLTAILRSLASHDNRWIEERSSLGTAALPEVELRVGGSLITYREGNWSSGPYPISVFDQVFINDNVHTGEEVDFEHRKSLHRFVVGERGVVLARAVEEHDQEVRKANEQLRLQEDALRRACPDTGGFSGLEFCTLAQVADIESATLGKLREIEALKDAERLARSAGPQELVINNIETDSIVGLLSASSSTVAAAAGTAVCEHLARLSDKSAEQWVRHGIGYVRDDVCPFCGQDIANGALAGAYAEYFTAAYDAMTKLLAETEVEVARVLSDAAVVGLIAAIESNEAVRDLWSKHVLIDYRPLNCERLRRSLCALRNGLVAAIGQKALAPLSPVVLDQSVAWSIRRLQRVRDLIAAYNGRVATTAAAIAEMQKTLAVTALADAEADYRRLLATSNRYSEPTFSICDRYLELLRVREDAVKAKELAREALGRYTADFLPKYEASINANLARLGVDFQIVQTKERHDGGTPSVDYRLQLCKSIVPLTPDKKNPICAHFANTLSSGDKAALAFAFFLTALQAQGLAGRIIVFDDPVSSLDCFRRQATCQELRRLGSEAAQLLLLSHDAFFLRHVWADFPKESKRTLCVLRSGDESIIEPWDIEQMVQGTYEQDHLLLTRYMTEGKCHDLRMIARCIRPFLEAHLRYRCPGHFEGLWLGEMIRSIRESTDEPLLGLQRLLQELSDTNEYSAPFHHDQNADWANHPVTDGELKTYVTRALALRGL